MSVECRHFWRRRFLIGGAAALAAACGCAPRIRTWTPPQSPDSLDNVSFLHYLATAPLANVDEAARAVLILLEPEAPPLAVQERMAAAQRKGLIRAGWKLRGEHVLTRGVLAYMLRRACELPAGANDALPAGVGDRRYAIRACADAGLLAHGAADESISGGELLGAIRSADAWQEAHSR
ncbi:MAG: hypothetical protein IT449_12370 [Phycisphaerales bacterium]|nr:hypothetical protein [Phycisphaerales bacterium]